MGANGLSGMRTKLKDLWNGLMVWVKGGIGLLFLLGIVGLWLLGVDEIWPDGFLDTPFASITFGMLLQVLGSLMFLALGLALVGVFLYWLFKRDSQM